jgi:hypothetical protein
MMRLNPIALAIAFGVAGVVGVILFGMVMGAMWGVMGGGSAMGGGWMHGGWMHDGGSVYGQGSMMSDGLGFFLYAVICGFVGGAVAGWVSAWVYNNVVARNT